MINAHEELLNKLKNCKLTYEDIICAKITLEDLCNDGEEIIIRLKRNYLKQDLYIFLYKLKFEYEDDYGSQALRGKIWLTDNRWLDRDYNLDEGTQWWSLKRLPIIPDDLL